MFQAYQQNETLKDQIFLTLSATYPNLQSPRDNANILKELETDYPGAFNWAGEINVFKHALAGRQLEKNDPLGQSLYYLLEILVHKDIDP